MDWRPVGWFWSWLLHLRVVGLDAGCYRALFDIDDHMDGSRASFPNHLVVIDAHSSEADTELTLV